MERFHTVSIIHIVACLSSLCVAHSHIGYWIQVRSESGNWDFFPRHRREEEGIVLFGVTALVEVQNCVGYEDPTFSISCDPTSQIEFYLSDNSVTCDYTSDHAAECRPSVWDPELSFQRSVMFLGFECDAGTGTTATAYAPTSPNITCNMPFANGATRSIILSYIGEAQESVGIHPSGCEQGTYDAGICTDTQTCLFSLPNATSCTLPPLSPLSVSIDTMITIPPATSEPTTSPQLQTPSQVNDSGAHVFLPGEEFLSQYWFSAYFSLHDCSFEDAVVEVSCGDGNTLVLLDDDLDETVACVLQNRSTSSCRSTLWDPLARSQAIQMGGVFTCLGNDALLQRSSVRLSRVPAIRCSSDANVATQALALYLIDSTTDSLVLVPDCVAGIAIDSGCVDTNTCTPVSRTCTTSLDDVEVVHKPWSVEGGFPSMAPATASPLQLGGSELPTVAPLVSTAEATNNSSIHSCSWEPEGPMLVGVSPKDIEFGTFLGMSNDGETLFLGSARGARVFRKNGNSWQQIGSFLSGALNSAQLSAELVGGTAISGDGKTVAIAFSFDANLGLRESQAYVQVYQISNSSNLERLGDDIAGLNIGDWFGYAVKLSHDGRTLAVGAPFGINESMEMETGYVCVYELLDDETAAGWTEKGNCIAGNVEFGRHGFSLDLSSSGEILSIGVPRDSKDGDSTGKVLVYFFDDKGMEWRQLGQDIRACGLDRCSSGYVTKLTNDGYTVAVGSGNPVGYAWVYEFDRDFDGWKQKGSRLSDGENTMFGSALAISANGTTLLVGAYGFDRDRGKATVYRFVGSDWFQIGNYIIGEDLEDFLGFREVAMSGDGSSIVVGSVGGDHDCGPDCGHAQMYRLHNIASCQQGVELPRQQGQRSRIPWPVVIPVSVVFVLAYVFWHRLSRLWWLWPGFKHTEHKGPPVTFFLSHRGPDTKDRLAKPLAYILEKLGVPVFLDANGMNVGSENYTDIAKNLHSCQFGVVILSDSFLDSPWCRKELKTLYRLHTMKKCKLIVFYESRQLYERKIFRRLRECCSIVRGDQLDRDYVLKVMVPVLEAARNNNVTSLGAFIEPRNADDQPTKVTNVSSAVDESTLAKYAAFLDQYLGSLRSTLDRVPESSLEVDRMAELQDSPLTGSTPPPPQDQGREQLGDCLEI